MKIGAIKVGDRVRKDMGDLASLAASIRAHGLLHPIVIKSDGTLVAGHRRLEAARLLEWTDIPVTVIDVEDLLTAERDENVQRKSFSPTEAVAIGQLIEDMHRAKIDEQYHALRVASGKARHGDRSSLNQIQSAGKSCEAAGIAVGMSSSTYREAREVVRAAEADPEKFGDLPEKMDESGRVHGAYREMRRRRGDATAGAQTPATTKPKRNGLRGDKTLPYEPKTAGQKQRAAGQKRRVIDCLSTMHGVASGINNIDVPMALSVCDKEEKDAWITQAKEIVRSVREFLSRL